MAALNMVIANAMQRADSVMKRKVLQALFPHAALGRGRHTTKDGEGHRGNETAQTELCLQELLRLFDDGLAGLVLTVSW